MHDPFDGTHSYAAAGQPHVVTIGTFDGVHRGHQHLLTQARLRAQELGLPLLVVTFEPIPAQVVRPDSYRGRLSSPQQRLDLLREWSAGEVVVVPFTAQVRSMSARAFIEHLDTLANIKELWVGEEFALGRDREGTIDALGTVGEELSFSVVAVPRKQLDDMIVSSSRVRQLVIAGDVEAASYLLGRPFRVSGTVIRGAQVGRTIGFPTANVEPPAGLVALADGIYASYATVGDELIMRPAMTYIGTRPALNTGNRQIETHLLDFNGDLYDQMLHTDVLVRLRPDADFESVEQLVAQLKVDEVDTRHVLAAYAQPSLAPGDKTSS